MKMITVLLLSLVLIMCPVTGAIWFPSRPHHHHQRVLIKFEEESHGNTRVTISEPEGENNIVSEHIHDSQVTDEAAGKGGEPKERMSEKLPDKIKSVGEKATEAVGKVGSTVANAIGMVSLGDKIEGTLKDSVVKIEDWDAIDSPKRIGEDIKQNASAKIEQGVEEVKETMENVKETNVSKLLTKSKNAISNVMLMVSLEKVRSVISFCYLLGFSTAYGVGVWVTFFSSSLLRMCLPKQQFAMVMNKINVVYFRLMTCCVGSSLFGYLVTQGRKGGFSTKMEIFQGFNLVFGFLMVLINLILLVPRATKLIAEGMKEKSLTESVAAEKLKKMNTYLSTLNASTMVMLTWHLAYISQLLQVRQYKMVLDVASYLATAIFK